MTAGDTADDTATQLGSVVRHFVHNVERKEGGLVC